MITIEHVTKVQSLFEWFFKLTVRNAIVVMCTIFMTYQYFQIKELKKEITQLQKLQNTNIDLEKKLNAISSEIVIFKASSDNFPFPYWIKDLNGKIIYINEAFVQKYLKPRFLTYTEYVGHYDANVFSISESEVYKRNDSLVLSTKRPLCFIEKAGKNLVRTVKFEYKLNGVVVGIAGVEYANFN